MNSVHNIVAIIETLLADGGELGVRELVSRTDVPKSTVQRFLAALQEKRWIVQNSSAQSYRVGCHLMNIANPWQLRLELVHAAALPMEALSKKTHLMTLLMVPDGLSALCLKKTSDERNALRVPAVVNEGVLVSLHEGAFGKVILAGAPKPLQRYFLRTEGRQKITGLSADFEADEKELDAVREQGYAIEVGSLLQGLASLAVPLSDERESLIGALCLIGAKNDVECRKDELIVKLREAGRNVLEQLKGV